MKIIGTRCDDCPILGVVDDLYKFYNQKNQLVCRIHQRVLDTPDGFQARLVAQDITWLEFEQKELAKTGPNDIALVFYEGHDGLLRLNSEYCQNLDQSKTQLLQFWRESMAWLGQRMNAEIEVI